MASTKKSLLKNKWLWISLAGALAAAGIAAKLLRPSGAAVVYYTAPRRETVNIQLVESGVLDSESSVNVIAPMVPRYRRLLIWLAPEGAVVKRGMPLAKCDTSDLERDGENLRLDMVNVRAKYQDTKVQYDITLDDLKNRVSQRVENQKIAQMNHDQMAFAADIDRQKALVSLNQAKMEVEFARTRIRAEEGRRDTALRLINDEISNAQAKIDENALFVERFVVTAPEDGLVVYPLIKIDGQDRKIQVGDSLYYGQVFLTLPNLFRMIVKIEVSEDDVKKIALGQRADLVLEAWKDRVYHGVIIHISNLAKIKENNKFVKVFSVKLKILEEDLERLKPGMNARVTVALRQWRDAVTLPLPFVSGVQGQQSVWAWDGKTLRNTPVALVDQTESLAVFTNGLPGRVLLVDHANQEALTATNARLDALNLREWKDAAR